MRNLVLTTVFACLWLRDENFSTVVGWSPSSSFRRSISKRGPEYPMSRNMAPTDFIDVEVTGHAKSSKKTKRKAKQTSKVNETRTKEILMPAISPSMKSGKVVEWLVRTGDTIRKGEPIMVIESEKEIQGARGYRMNQDVNANVDGVLAAIYQQPGQAVDVGAVLGIIVPDQIIDVEIDKGNSSAFMNGESDESGGGKNLTATTSSTSQQEDDVVAATTATVKEDSMASESLNSPDWVHGHHADAGPVSNQPMYSKSTSIDAGGSSSSQGSQFSAPFTGSIDSTDSFYDPYNGLNDSSTHQKSSKQQDKPPTSDPRVTDRSRDSFYEAYRGTDYRGEATNPFVAEGAQWHQHPNNSNMGPYYKAEFNEQLRGPPFDHQPPPYVRGHESPPTFSNGFDGVNNNNQALRNEKIQERDRPDIISDSAQTRHNLESKANEKSNLSSVGEQEKTLQEGGLQVDDHAKTTVVESRIADLEKLMHLNGEDASMFSAHVHNELAHLRAGLVDLERNYGQKVKSLEDSYQNSLLQVGRDFTETIEELRDWDSITVTWDIQDFEKSLRSDLTTYTSEEFTVAGYAMTLEMQIFGPNEDGSRDVGFYIMHTGGLNFVPIMIGGSKITIQASGNDADNAIKVFVEDASIEDSHYGWGWKKFFSLQDLRQSFVNSNGQIEVTATVRVKRVRSCRLSTAL